MKKSFFTFLVASMLTATTQANTVNDAQKLTLENNTVSYFAEPKLTLSQSKKFLTNHHFFDAHDNNIWHSPIHIPDGQEEADLAMPVVLAVTQNKVVVGVGGLIEGDLLENLSNLAYVKCTQTPLQDTQIERLTVCMHQVASSQTAKQFTDDLEYLIYNSN